MGSKLSGRPSGKADSSIKRQDMGGFRASDSALAGIAVMIDNVAASVASIEIRDFRMTSP